MGNSVEQWRASIGGFCQPVKSKSRLKTLQVKCRTFVSLAIRITLFLLLVVEGVEANPGPPRSNPADPGRGRGNCGYARGQGPQRGRGSRYNDYFADYSDSESRQMGGLNQLRRSQRLQDRPREPRQGSSSQTSISNWLTNHPSQPGHDMTRDPERQNMDPPSDTSDHETDTDLFRNDVPDPDLGSNTNATAILLEIRKDVKHMNKKFDNLDKKVKEPKLDNIQLKQQNQTLSNQVTDLTTTVISLESRVIETEKKNEQLEAQSRLENLKFYGVNEDEGETWDQSETKIRDYLSQELGLDEASMKIERAHRLPSKSKPRPIIVKFPHFKDKDQVLKKYRAKRREQQEADDGPNGQGDNTEGGDPSVTRPVRVSEDFPQRVTKARTNLFPFLKNCHENEQEAYLRFDTLVVNG